MSDSMHQSRSPAAHAVAPDAVEPELNHPAVDLDHRDLNDPMDDQDQDSSFSDSESIVTTDQSGLAPAPCSGLMELSEGDMVHRFMKETFLSQAGVLRPQVTVVAIHQNCYCSGTGKARARAFQFHAQAVRNKGNGDTANLRYAWYATSKEGVSKILSYGFGCSGKPENSGLYGHGLYFAPENHLLESAKVAPMDKDGLRHLLLCRVILGKSELVSFGSEQSHPSSERYDSGVDNLSSPTRYIIWSTHMNTHVLPEFIISFRAPCRLRVLLRTLEKTQKPTSPQVPLPIFISELSKILLPPEFKLISKYYKDHEGGKISRYVLIQKVRQITGDGLLIEIIKSLDTKQLGA